MMTRWLAILSLAVIGCSEPTAPRPVPAAGPAVNVEASALLGANAACTRDDECVLFYARDPRTPDCCRSTCDPLYSGRKDWLAKLDAACGSAAKCPPPVCAAPPHEPRAVCVTGRCAVAFAR
jgi:hypothetical protein